MAVFATTITRTKLRFVLALALICAAATKSPAATFQLSFSDQDLLQNGLTVLPYTTSPLTAQSAWQTVTGPYTAAGSQIGISSYNSDTDQLGDYGDDVELYGSDPANPTSNTTDPNNSFFVGEFKLPRLAQGSAPLNGDLGMVVLFNQTFTLPAVGSYFTGAMAEVHVRNLLNEDGSQGGGAFQVAFVMGQIDPQTNTLQLYGKGLNGGFSNNSGTTGEARQGDWFLFGNISDPPINWGAFQGQSIFGNAGASPSTTLDTVFGFYVSASAAQVDSEDRFFAFAADNFQATVYGEGSATTSTFDLEALTAPEPRGALALTLVVLSVGALLQRRFRA